MIETRIYKCEYCGAEFDDEYEAHCHEWVCRYDDQIKKWKDIKNKFIKDGQYMLGKIMEYMFGGFLIVFTGILMIALIALIVWLIIDFIRNGA